jgi:hypothetical protein
METCGGCDRRYPRGLLQDLTVGGVGSEHREEVCRMCPLCALKIRNRLAGLPADTPFQGRLAKELHAKAVAHLERTGQRL